MNIQEVINYVFKWIAHIAADVLENIFVLVVMIERGLVPWWHWPVVVAALVYLVSPMDAAPDPVFADDAGVLAAAVAVLGSAVTGEVRKEASARARKVIKACR